MQKEFRDLMPQDESRQRTIKFLLLRMAKNFRAKDQSIFEDALRTLTVTDDKDNWRISAVISDTSTALSVPKTSFSLYQTRVVGEIDIDPGAKKQLSALKILSDLFSDLKITHHQFKLEKKSTFLDLLLKNPGLIYIISALTLGLLALSINQSWLIYISLANIAAGFFSSVANLSHRTTLIIFALAGIYALITQNAEPNVLSFLLCNLFILIVYLTQIARRSFGYELFFTVGVLGLTTVLAIGNFNGSHISLAIICVASLGLSMFSRREFPVILRSLGIVALLTSSIILIFFALTQSAWTLLLLVFMIIQALILTITGSERSIVRLLIIFPLLGSVL